MKSFALGFLLLTSSLAFANSASDHGSSWGSQNWGDFGPPIDNKPIADPMGCSKAIKALEIDPYFDRTLCYRAEFSNDVQTAEFGKCAKKLRDLQLDDYSVIGACSTPSHRNDTLKLLKDPEFSHCITRLTSLDINDYPVELCRSRYKKKALYTDDFGSCVKSARRNNWNAFYLDNDMRDLLSDCTASSESSAYRNVIKDCIDNPAPQEDAEAPARAVQDFNIHTGVKQTFHSPAPPPPPPPAGTAKSADPNASHGSIGGYSEPPARPTSTTVEIGGLSGLIYDPKQNEFYSVTDDRWHAPYIMSWKYSIDNKGIYQLVPSGIRILKDKYGFSYGSDFKGDHEDLVILPNGNFLLTTELDDYTENDYSKLPLLQEFDRDGKLVRNWTPPAAFASDGKWVKRLKAPSTTDDGVDDGGDPDFGSLLGPIPKRTLPPAGTVIQNPIFGSSSLSGSSSTATTRKKSRDDGPIVIASAPHSSVTVSSGPPAPTSNSKSTSNSASNSTAAPKPKKPVAPYYVEEYEQTAGLRGNKGFEALALSPDGKTLFVANEANMIQDSEGKVRIAAVPADGGPHPEAPSFVYPLERAAENGLVAMRSLGPNRLLTMERSYDRETQKLTVRVFEIDPTQLNKKGEIDRADKKKIVDVGELTDQFAPGFRSLDNFEGMTLGPTLPNGDASLMLVSDNNFSYNQKTKFLLIDLKNFKP